MIKTITVLPQADTEKYLPLYGEAIISITEPGQNPARLRSGWTDTLRIQFGDARYDPATIAAYQNNWTNVPGAFLSAHATEIHRYIDRLEQNHEITALTIHCYAGISRSTAVAAWVAERYGIPIPLSWMGMNRTILDILRTPSRYQSD